MTISKDFPTGADDLWLEIINIDEGLCVPVLTLDVTAGTLSEGDEPFIYQARCNSDAPWGDIRAEFDFGPAGGSMSSSRTPVTLLHSGILNFPYVRVFSDSRQNGAAATIHAGPLNGQDRLIDEILP